MAIHWQVKFRSLRYEILYTANIYDDHYTGEPVLLTGAANPFDTQEDDSDDIFKSIRTQTGYLRIVDTGKDNSGNAFDWRDIIPSSDVDRPVTLTYETGGSERMAWAGFIQPRNFGVQLYGNPQAVEFPLQCPLSIMEGIDINYTVPDIHNFAFLLKTAIDTIPSVCRPDTFIIQGSTHAQDWLLKCICWQNFAQKTESNGNEAKMSMYDALVGMAQYWGWTVRLHRNILYLVCPDDYAERKFLYLTYNDLTTMANGTAAGNPTVTFIERDFDEGFANNDNVDSQLRGPYKAVIDASVSEMGQYMIDPLDKDFEWEAKNTTWANVVSYDGTILSVSGEISEINRSDFQAKAFTSYAAFRQIRKAGTDDAPLDIIEIQKSYRGNVFIRFTMNYARSYSDGFFIIHGLTYRGIDEYIETETNFYQGNREMFARLYISNQNEVKYWNGKAWQDTETEFVMTIGNRKPQYFSRYWESIDPPSRKTFSIINTGTLYGVLTLELLGSGGTRAFPQTDGESKFNLTDFKVEFIKNNTVIKDGPFPNSGWYYIDERRLPAVHNYEAINGNRTREKYDDDNIFYSENLMKPSFGTVLNPDGSYSGVVSYGTGAITQFPEQHKANRIADYWAASKRKMEISVRSNASMQGIPYEAVTPQWKLIIENTYMYPLSISHRWNDDIIMFILTEI